MEMEDTVFDAAVIGCGIVGVAVARELSIGVGARVVLLEKGDDALPERSASCGNSSMLHSAFDARPYAEEARLMREGAERWWALLGLGEDGASEAEGELAARLRRNPPFEARRAGAVVVAWNEEEAAALPPMIDRAHANCAHRTRLLDAAEVRERLPGLAEGALGGIEAAGEATADGWRAGAYLLHQALAAGARLMTRSEALSARWDAGAGAWRVVLPGGREVLARSVVNAAGAHADLVESRRRSPAAAGAGMRPFRSRPRRGQFLVLRAPDGFRVPAPAVLPVPSRRTKGVLVWPAPLGGGRLVVVGPTAEEQAGREGGSAPDPAVAERLAAHAARVYPALRGAPHVLGYVGVRPGTDWPGGGYVLRADPRVPWVTAAGVRSTGFTSCLGVSRRVLDLWLDLGVPGFGGSSPRAAEDDPRWREPPPGWDAAAPASGGRVRLCGREHAVGHPLSRL